LIDVYKDDNDRKKSYATIASFTNRFPDISIIQQLQDIDIFILEEE